MLHTTIASKMGYRLSLFYSLGAVAAKWRPSGPTVPPPLTRWDRASGRTRKVSSLLVVHLPCRKLECISLILLRRCLRTTLRNAQNSPDVLTSGPLDVEEVVEEV